MISLKIISPAETLFDGNADFLVLPGSEGQLGILPKHAPLLSTLTKGTIRIKQNGAEKKFDIEQGFARVFKNRAIVLSTSRQVESSK